MNINKIFLYVEKDSEDLQFMQYKEKILWIFFNKASWQYMDFKSSESISMSLLGIVWILNLPNPFQRAFSALYGF